MANSYHVNPLQYANYMMRANVMGMRDAQFAQQQARGMHSRQQGTPGVDVNPFAFLNPDFQQSANALLQPYGLKEPTQVQSNVILPNGGFFGAHPRLSSALEGAMLGAANTNSAMTPGEGIQNVIRGVIGARQEKAEMQAAPFQAPINAAMSLEQLRDLSDKHALNDALIQWHRAQAAKAEQDPVQKFRPPVPVEGGAWVQTDPNKPYEFVEGPGGKAMRTGGLEGTLITNMLGPRPTTPGKAQQQYDQRAWGMFNQHSTVAPIAGANARGDQQERMDKVRAGRDFFKSQTLDEKGKASYYHGIGLDPIKGQGQAKAHNQRVADLANQWEDEYVSGKTSLSASDWYHQREGQPSMASGGANTFNSGTGSPLQQLINAVTTSKAAQNVGPKQFVAPTPTPQRPPDSISLETGNPIPPPPSLTDRFVQADQHAQDAAKRGLSSMFGIDAMQRLYNRYTSNQGGM